MYFKSVIRLVLISLLTIFIVVPAAMANEQVNLMFNGQEYQADIYMENGVSYISATSLSKIPGLTVDQDGYVALRDFFEGKGAHIGWDSSKNQIIVSWQEKQDEWAADELMVESTDKMREVNTYKMKGEATIEMVMAGSEEKEIPDIPEMTTYLEAVYQQDPLAMYMHQTVKIPVEETGLTEEDMAILDQGEMVTEMVWKDNAIYQKMPFFDKWIVQDLAGLGMMDKLTNLLQTTPQQSLEMMRDFGVINVFGENVVIDGQEYYVVKTYVDGTGFKKVAEEILSELDLGSILNSTQGLAEQDEEKTTIVMEETQQLLEQILANMDLNYYIDTLINKETLFSEYMNIDLAMNIKLDETVIPEGPVNIEMKMNGEYELFDFGAEIQLPDVSDAITQQEFLQQMEEMMEIQEEPTVQVQ